MSDRLPDYPSAPSGLPQGHRHEGRCGIREFCWRDECREAYGDYRTIERLRDGSIIVRCHGSRPWRPGWERAA